MLMMIISCWNEKKEGDMKEEGDNKRETTIKPFSSKSINCLDN